MIDDVEDFVARIPNPVTACGNCLRGVRDFLYPPPPPVEINTRICDLCFESGATKRKCCNRLYCDHCYTKNRQCPYCLTSTRQEKMTGATFAVEAFSEVEECRCCLELGIKRKCCGSYYCDDCFYKQPQCRFCDAPVVKTDDSAFKGFATVLSIIISWLATIFFVLVVVAFALVMSVNESQTKVMMSSYKCYGLFKDCTVDICAEMDPAVASGDSAVQALASWKPCNLESVAKINAKACIFDPQLYLATTVPTLRNNPNLPEPVGVMGYDLCMDKFQNGVYIFEDMFEAWGNFSYKSNVMKSALWSTISNGHATPFCGVGQALGGSNALVFSGDGQRFAETLDVDVSSGGWLEAELFISPVGFDLSHPLCKSSYGGGVDVEYSTNEGKTWTSLDHFDAFVYRQETFFPVKFLVDAQGPAATSHTRFRFIQRAFTAARDQWALDNVRVLRNLPPKWHDIGPFMTNVRYTLSWMQRAQCCFDTDWCETRLSLEQMDDCAKDFPAWYHGRRYLLRGSELYVMVVVLVYLVKFVYTATADYIIKGRLPFQSEWEDLTKMDRIMKYLPPRYRPKKTLESFVGNVHLSARLSAELVDAFKDGEGTGEAVLSQEDQDALKRQEAERLKKERRALKRRMKRRNFKVAAGDGGGGGGDEEGGGGKKKKKKGIDDDDDHDDDEDDLDDDEEAKADLGGAAASSAGLPTNPQQGDLEKFKKQNVGMLRQPFDTRVDKRWTLFFRNYNLGLLALLTLIKIGTTSYYEVHQPLLVFGQLKGDLQLTSLAVFFFAFCCDLKEIYYTLKNIVPCRDEWVPYITIDLQEDVSALFIGEHVVALKDIGEIVPFPPAFILLNALGFFIGCFPWCLFSIILRDQFLTFTSMRIVTPALALVSLARAILGPAFVIKTVFSFYYLFAFDTKTRERAGIACQATKTRTSAATGMLLVSLVLYLVAGIVAFDLATTVFGCALVVGLLYGAFTGCTHGLPIRPWMVLTCLRGGVWMRVKKKQRCPCIYWGSFCTDMHDAEEVFVIYSTDDMRFLSVIKTGAAATLAG